MGQHRLTFGYAVSLQLDTLNIFLEQCFISFAFLSDCTLPPALFLDDVSQDYLCSVKKYTRK